LTLFYL